MQALHLLPRKFVISRPSCLILASMKRSVSVQRTVGGALLFGSLTRPPHQILGLLYSIVEGLETASLTAPGFRIGLDQPDHFECAQLR